MRVIQATVVAFLLLVPALTPAHADDVLGDQWDRIHMQGAYAGYTHTRTLKVEDGDTTRIETHVHSEIKMNRMGSVLVQKSDSVTWESETGALLRIESKSSSSGQADQHIVWTFADGKLKIETTVLDRTETVEREVDADLLGPYAVWKRQARLMGTTGESCTAKFFMAELNMPMSMTATSHGEESVETWGGDKRTLTKIVTVVPGFPAKPISWHQADGEAIVQRMDMMGLRIDTYRVANKEAATKDDGGKPASDLFAATLIQEKGPVPVPRHVEAAVIIVTKKDADAELPTYTSAAHEVVTQVDGVQHIKAVRLTPPEGKYGRRPLEEVPEELKAALAPNSMIQSDAPEIMKIAEEVLGDETRAWQSAQMLETWVYEGVTEKNMGVGFATALDVCRDREGDCTEHAVLLAALCRAAGIPARVVMGFEYLFGIWGGHAWNEVWIEGTWYPLDATLGYGFADPLHLPLSHMTLADGDFGTEFMGMMSTMGKVQLDVAQVTRNGRTIDVNDESLVTTKDRTYRDAVWGLTFDAPEGFTFDPPKPKKGMSFQLMELDGKTASGKTVEITVRAVDAPPGSDLNATLAMFRIDLSQVQKNVVDDRIGRYAIQPNGDRLVLVIVDDALYLFELDGAEGPAELKAFDTFLASVDFDVR